MDKDTMGLCNQGSIKELQQVADKICEERGLPKTKVIWNYRLSTVAGRYKRNLFLIEISNRHYLTFGYEKTEKVLRHEIAHHIAWVKHNHKSHGEIFKKICMELGGQMNAKFAKGEYAACKGVYCKTTRRRMRYECVCGVIFFRKSRLFKDRVYSCRKCGRTITEYNMKGWE